MQNGSQSVGHPVDVATGVMHNTFEDISIPGKVALKWSRFYSTALKAEISPLGSGWFNKYFCSLKFENKQYTFKGPDGSPIIVSDPEDHIRRGGTIRNLGAFTELWFKDGSFVVCQWDVESGEVWRYLFPYERNETGGRIASLTEIQDPTGQGVELTYDVKGRLGGIRQKLEKRALVLHYNNHDRIESIEFQSYDKSTCQTLFKYAYDQKGRLVTAVDASDYSDYFEYSGDDLIVRECTKDGAVTTFKYDNKGRCVRSRGLDGYDEKILRYMDSAGWTEVTDSLGHVRRFLSNGDGQILREINPLNAEYVTEYDEYGRIVAKTDPNGNVTGFEYDDWGNRCKFTDASGHVTKRTYNDNHQLIKYINPEGNSWCRFYDRTNYLVAIEDPEGYRYKLFHDDNGNLVEMTDPLGNHLLQSFTAQGVMHSATDFEGNTNHYQVDAFGRLTELIDPLNNHVFYHYDTVGNLTRIDHPDSTHNEYDYDAAKNLIRATDRNGHTTQSKFGPCSRLSERIDPLGRTISFIWDSEPGRLEAVTNAKGETYEFDYNEIGLVVGESGFDGRKLIYEYDLAGSRIARINGIGERIEYQSDALGQILCQKLPDGGQSLFSYDKAGFLVRACNADSDILFKRDSLGRISTETQNGHVIERRYDAAGNLQQLQSTLGLQIDYEFDANGLLTQFRVNDHDPTTFERDARGSEIHRSLPGQHALHQQYDSVGRLTGQTLLSGAALAANSTFGTPKALMQRNYQYEKARLVGLYDQYWGNAAYIYDPAERVTQVLRERGASENFQYDDNNNITQIERGDSISTLNYSQGDRLEYKDDVAFHYDTQGHLVKKTEKQPDGHVYEWHYEWDSIDQLRVVTDTEGKSWHYIYDPFGRRIQKRMPDGKLLEFIWDKDVVLHELKNDNESTVDWVFDPHSFRPLCKLQSGKIFSVITDHLGTPLELLDRTGRVVWQMNFQTWGDLSEQIRNEIDCPVRFQGQWYDQESGLHYNRFRYYDPGCGRYISHDPIRLSGGLNLYSYTPNPLAYFDPWGLETYITYLGEKDGKPYAGFASHPGDVTGDAVLSRRYNNSNRPGDPAILYEGPDRATARGLEQRTFEIIEGRENTRENLLRPSNTSNEQNPVGMDNERRDEYLAAADRHLEENPELRDELEEAGKACDS